MKELVPWTAEDFADSFQRHMPTGPVWPRDPATTQRETVTALMPTYVRSWKVACALPTETLPSTAVNLLPEWESSLGLPDPCAGPDATIEQRQVHVVGRLTQQNGASIPALTAFAETILNYAAQYLTDQAGNPLTDQGGNLLTTQAASGFTIDVKEYAPSRFGQARFGSRFAGEDWAFAWVVVAADPAVRGMALECELQRLKPAETLLGFLYTATLGTFVLGQNAID